MRFSRLLRAVVFMCVPVLADQARAADMTFVTVPYTTDPSCRDDCPRLMQASGQITKATPQAFVDFARREIQKPGLINVLLIHSPGGSVNSSIALGRVLRKLGTVVVVARAMSAQDLPGRTAGGRQHGLPASLRFVSGTCASACVYALAGGARRVVPPESRVAVHRMAGNIGQIDPATREYRDERVYAGEGELSALTEYIAAMGVSTELVEIAESVPHEDAHILSERDIRRLNLGRPKL